MIFTIIWTLQCFLVMIQEHTVVKKKNFSAESLSCSKFQFDAWNWECRFCGWVFPFCHRRTHILLNKLSVINIRGLFRVSPLKAVIVWYCFSASSQLGPLALPGPEAAVEIVVAECSGILLLWQFPQLPPAQAGPLWRASKLLQWFWSTNQESGS